jgi:hypothetical protein
MAVGAACSYSSYPLNATSKEHAHNPLPHMLLCMTGLAWKVSQQFLLFTCKECRACLSR